MKIHLLSKRKLKKTLRQITAKLSDILTIPLVKPAAIIVAALCILLILAPYLLMKFNPGTGQPAENRKTQASFELVELPKNITIYRAESKKTETLDFEDYVKGVVSGEMPASFHEEALKAQSVAARTYSAARILRTKNEGNPSAHPDAPLCDATHCQVYRSIPELEKLKGEAWMKEDWKKICDAVDQTKGQLLYYNGELVEQALFHSSSGGKTENAEDVFAAAVPYLVSVESPYEENATHQNEEHSYSIEELSKTLKAKHPSISFGTLTADNIKIISRSKGGRVEKMQIGNGSLTGRQVREALNLPSANFTIDIKNNIVTFTSSGSGHGVGMSQYGADGMAKQGYDYKEILEHYYRGTEVF